MPELPDVEGHRRTVAEHAAGRPIRGVAVPDPDLLHGATPQGLGRAVTGRVVDHPGRHGKWLIVATDDGHGPSLLFHFAMTGELVWSDHANDDPRDVLALRFDNGQLTYRERRRLGRVTYLPAGGDVSQVTGPLGPDATEVDAATLEGLLSDRRGGVKSALMDQALIAGLGNELVDEILWRAGLHPRRRAAALTGQEFGTLQRAMRDVLRRSIRAGHVPSGPTWLNRVRAEDAPECPRCGAGLARATVSGRTTLWCPREQSEAA